MASHGQIIAENRPLAIYVHIPFCAKHCAYCDFNTYVEKAQSRLTIETADAICQDIETAAQSLAPAQQQRPIDTVFFGGGTPTFLSGAQLAQILSAIRSHFALSPAAEISSEANPSSSDAEKFAQMFAAGFNRLSVGVQAFDDALLVALDRFHTAGEAERALKSAREAGFQNINLDLMYGLPKQTLPLWEHTLARALEMQTEHLSLYALTLEPGTRFERLHAGGKLPLPEEDAELEMLAISEAKLEAAGYTHYEISNYAKAGYVCRHNLVYWHNEEYLGFGPGAVSYFQGRRWKRERLPQTYIKKLREGVDLTVESETLAPEESLGETLMLGLRLAEGVSLSALAKRFEIAPQERYADTLRRLQERGMILFEGDRLSLTPQGALLANEVLWEFLPDA